MPKTVDTFIFRLFIFWYVVGVILLSFHLVPPSLEWANAVFLMLCGVLGGFYFIRSFGGFAGGVTVFVIMSFSIGAEVLGVRTGLLFGEYEYNPDFGIFLFDVPLTIGTAWLMVIAVTHAVVSPLFKRTRKPLITGISYVLCASFLAVCIDLVIDPVAYEVKSYWEWTGEEGFYYGIPFSNFVGWLIVAITLHTWIYVFFTYQQVWQKKPDIYWDSRTKALFFMIVFMFTFLCLINGLWLASLLGLLTMMVALGLILMRKGR